MRPDSAPTSPHDDSSGMPGQPGPAKPRPRIVPLEGNDAIALFQSEQDSANRWRNPFGKAANGFSLPPALATRFAGRNTWLAVLALIVVAQAAFIALWMFANRPVAAAPEGGSVTVTSEPSGSPVTIDGTSRGVTPLAVTLAAGAHQIDVGGSGQVRSQSLNVSAGQAASIHVALAPVPAVSAAAGTGGLRIVTEPPGARVWIDGELRGTAPVTASDLKVGDHVVTVRGRSGDAVNRTVTVEAATVGSLIVSLGSPATFASGWLAISSEVPLQIRENGTVLGTTDAPRLLLPAGAHELELANAGLDYVVARRVQIEAGQTTSVTLKAPMGKISINAIPWAEVLIDGQRVGETPIGNLSVAIGNHELLFRHPELGERRRAISVGAVTPQRIGVDMNKP